jgi:NAD-dependent deacetylase
MEPEPEPESEHPTANEDDVELARVLVAAAERIVVLTGAGISTDSGIPDFRGPRGVWTRDPEAEKLATISHYLGNPEARVKAWRRRIDGGIYAKQPNAGHRALVDLERTGRLRLVITQNVDGLHRAAGTDPARLAEVHGNVREVECVSCGARHPIAVAVARVEAGEADPPCEDCGGILKPTVVFFGESLPVADIERAFDAAGDADLFLAVGTTLGVYPVADTVPTALRAGARLVILNAEATAFDREADIVLPASISDTLPRLVAVPTLE